MTDAKTEIENIQGYRAVTVVLDDGSPCEVKIKKLNVYELQVYASVFAQQGPMVELFIGKEKEFVSHITAEECFRIIKIGRDINDPILTLSSEMDGAMLDYLLNILSKKAEGQKRLASLSGELFLKPQSLPAKVQPT